MAKAVLSACKAGEAVLDVYNAQSFDIKTKDDLSPVTEADTRSQGIIQAGLADMDIPFLGEEGKQTAYSKRKSWERFWLVDPLDGTKEFIKHNGEFTINIALIYGDSPVLGIIYSPVDDIMYFSVNGKGAFRIKRVKQVLSDSGDFNWTHLVNISERLPVDRRKSTDEIRVAVSHSHLSGETEKFLELLRQHYSKVEIISVGSSIKLCHIAEGRADIYPRFGPTMEWDTAAGQAIVEEVGGSLLSFPQQKPFVYNKENLKNTSFIASFIHEKELNQIIEEFKK